MTRQRKPEDQTETDKSSLRRGTGLVSFGKDARGLLKPILGRKGFIEADILSHWEDILGSDLSVGVTACSVSVTKDRTILHVSAFSGAYALAFDARKEQILERVNSYFGYQAVSDIRLIQGGRASPLLPSKKAVVVSVQEKAEILPLTSSIQDESLREAATELGVLVNRTKKD